MARKAFSSKWVICICIAVVGPTTAFGDLVNGDFSITDIDHLDFGWEEPAGGTDVSENRAVFSEEEAIANLMTLKQEVTLESGEYILSYHISFISLPGESDYFDVTWGDGTPLLSMNNKIGHEDYTLKYDGLVDLSTPDVSFWYAGTVNHSLEVLGTLTNTLEFSLSVDDPAKLAFVSIDNVNIAPVPVPGSVLLGGLGLAIANWRLRRRQAS